MENKTLSDKIDAYDPITQLVVRGDIKEAVKELIDKHFFRFNEELRPNYKECTDWWPIFKEIFGEELI